MLCGPPAQAQDFPERLQPAPQNQAVENDGSSDSATATDAPSAAPPQSYLGPARPGVVRFSSIAAQTPPPAPPGAPPPDVYVPPVYSYPAGADPSAMSAWPNASPFEHLFDQTFRQSGLWFNRTNDTPRQYFFTLGYLDAQLAQPEGNLIGDRATNAFQTNNPNSRTILTPPQPAAFPTYDARAFGTFGQAHDWISGGGLNARFGMINPDDSMFIMEGFWISTASEQVRPDGRVQPDANLANPSGTNQLQARAGIPLFNGQPGGTSAFFDSDFLLQYQSGAYGADADWYTTPLLEWGAFKLRGLYGVKYLGIQEQFHVHGADSGLGYFLTFSGPGDPYGVSSGPFVPVVPPYTTDVYSSTRSNLAGPSLGIRYDLGGKRFKIWGATRVTAAADNERISLYGNNLANMLNPPAVPTPSNPNPLAFSLSSTHTHVSPVVDTSIFIDVPVFDYVPYLRNTRIFKPAVFRFGYNFIYAGQIARPADEIKWITPTPAITGNHSDYTLGAFNFAINWQF